MEQQHGVSYIARERGRIGQSVNRRRVMLLLLLLSVEASRQQLQFDPIIIIIIIHEILCDAREGCDERSHERSLVRYAPASEGWA